MQLASPFDNFTYVIEADKEKPANEQRRLIGHYPTVRERAFLSDMQSEISASGAMRLNTGTSNLMAVHIGLVKMENFFDRSGKQIILERSSKPGIPGNNLWEESALEYIPEIDFIQFAIKIKEGGHLNEAELKN